MKKLFTIALVFILMPMLFGTPNKAAAKNAFSTEKTPSIQAKVNRPIPQAGSRGVMINEGFEGTFPPSGWDTLSAPGGTAGGATPIPWHQDDTYYMHTGTYGAAYGWGYNLNGWLRILHLDFSQADSIILSFWWESSYYWHVSPYDNGDLFVEVSTDNGINWDTLWTFGDQEDVTNSGVPWPWDDWVWYNSTLNLSSYAAQADVYIGFHVVADDNADMGMDDIQIDTTTVNINEQVEISPKTLMFKASTIINGTAKVEFTLPSPTNTNLAIYDVSGRLCRTLLSRRLSGSHHIISVKFDSPTGVYFYNLKTETGVNLTRKFLAVR